MPPTTTAMLAAHMHRSAITASTAPQAAQSGDGMTVVVVIMVVLLVAGVAVALSTWRRWPNVAGTGVVVAVLMGLGLLAFRNLSML